MEINNKLLSIVLLSYYSKERIVRVYESLGALLQRENIPFEFIVMDDGSNDNSYQIALELEKKCSNVTAYKLSRNYGSFFSCFAGIERTHGACVMPIVDDEQQPYETVVACYRLWEQGNKIVIPHRVSRSDHFISKHCSQLFYKVMNALSDVKYPEGGCDLALFDREVADILNHSIRHINTSLIPELLRLGFSPIYYPYERPLGLNKGKSRWTLKKKVRLALDTFFSASSFPIKFITCSGILFSGLSILMVIFYFFAALFWNSKVLGMHVPGWSSIIIAIFFFGGMTLLSLGIIAEYIFRIYEEVKNRPPYIVMKK